MVLISGAARKRRSIAHSVRLRGAARESGPRAQFALDRFTFCKRDLLLLDQLLQLSDSRLRLLEFPAKTPGATEGLGTPHFTAELRRTRFLPRSGGRISRARRVLPARPRALLVVIRPTGLDTELAIQ